MQLDFVLDEMKNRYDKVLDGYGEILPELVVARKKRFGKLPLVFWTSLLLSHLRLRKFVGVKKLPEYIFINVRYPEIILNYNKEDVAVIGGIKEFKFCFENGYRFVWGGFITRAFNLFYWAGETRPILAAIDYLTALLPTRQGFVFLWEDALPTGIVLSKVVSKVDTICSICIAHGCFGRSKTGITQVGEMCQANFVWSRNQIELFAQYGIDNCFILGVPYDIEAPSEVTNEVVLVGHCGRESSDAEYFYTVSQFIKIHQILCDAGCIVSYRPHPQDDLEMVKSVFPNVTRTLTKDLLRSRRGVYIGFASTFMFECKNSGSVVIGLATDWLSDERDFSVDAEVQPSEYAELPALVRKLTMELYDKPMPDLAPLSSRLSCCMDELRTSMQE